VPFSSLALKFGNYPPELTNDLLFEAQSVYFFTLVVMQWGYVIVSFIVWHRVSNVFSDRNLLSTRTRRSSILQQPPTWNINRTTIPAAFCALLIGIFFCYVPVLYVSGLGLPVVSVGADHIDSHKVFQTSNIPVEHFFIPLTFALGLIV
jgi:sodium/potassium-transporting ATPase subunit alpha